MYIGEQQLQFHRSRRRGVLTSPTQKKPPRNTFNLGLGGAEIPWLYSAELPEIHAASTSLPEAVN